MRATAQGLPNSTPVLWGDGTVHRLLDDGTTWCGEDGGGRPTTLAQALVYLSANWCRSCFRNGRP